MAIHWWLASGTYQKMEADVYALQGGSSWGQAVWTPIHVRGNEVSLTLSHLLPSFGVLAVGIIPSAIAFLIEVIHLSCYKKAKYCVTVMKMKVNTEQDIPLSEIGQDIVMEFAG